MLTLQVAAFAGAAVLLPAGVILLLIGLRRPLSSVTALTPVAMHPPHLIHPFVPIGPISTAGERQACRKRLGDDHGTHLVLVADLLARRPADLRAITMDADDLPIDDLVAVSAYLHGIPAGLDLNLRTGSGREGPDQAVVACLRSGLSRFPVRAGACHALVLAPGVPLGAYRPGEILLEPAFLRAGTGTSSGPTEGPGALRFAFWSRTGRRVSVLDAGPGPDSDPASEAVLFAPGTRFQVLATEPSPDGRTPGTVLVSECPAAADRFPALRWLGRRRDLARLRRAAPRPASSGPGPEPAGGRNSLARLVFAPGFDDTGRPFRAAPTKADAQAPGRAAGKGAYRR